MSCSDNDKMTWGKNLELRAALTTVDSSLIFNPFKRHFYQTKINPLGPLIVTLIKKASSQRPTETDVAVLRSKITSKFRTHSHEHFAVCVSYYLNSIVVRAYACIIKTMPKELMKILGTKELRRMPGSSQVILADEEEREHNGKVPGRAVV